MKKYNTLDKCRYYKGEKDFKGDKSKNNFRFWMAEKAYVEDEGTQCEIDAVKFYLACGLAGANFDLPLELRASLFEIYCKGSDIDPILLATSFKDEFLPNYLARPQ